MYLDGDFLAGDCAGVGFEVDVLDALALGVHALAHEGHYGGGLREALDYEADLVVTGGVSIRCVYE